MIKQRIISPSILSCDFMNIENELKVFNEEKNLWMHLDVMDGHFVPNLTFGVPIIKMISKISKVPLDAHFMVTNPKDHLDWLKGTKLQNFTFHHEATKDSLELIIEGKKYFPSMGISIKPKTNVNELSHEILKNIDLILVMSVEPGFGGQSFIEGTFDKIKKLNQMRKENNYNYMIQVDGGVSDKNSASLFEAGADNLVAGSFVFKGEDYLKNVASLRSE